MCDTASRNSFGCTRRSLARRRDGQRGGYLSAPSALPALTARTAHPVAPAPPRAPCSRAPGRGTAPPAHATLCPACDPAPAPACVHPPAHTSPRGKFRTALPLTLAAPAVWPTLPPPPPRPRAQRSGTACRCCFGVRSKRVRAARCTQRTSCTCLASFASTRTLPLTWSCSRRGSSGVAAGAAGCSSCSSCCRERMGRTRGPPPPPATPALRGSNRSAMLSREQDGGAARSDQTKAAARKACIRCA